MRKKLVTLHLWFGLTIGLLWAVQGLSGALLVFHQEIERLAGPATSAGPQASLDTVIARAAKAANAPIDTVSVTDGRGDLLSAWYRDAEGHKRAQLVDAATARILAAHDREPALPAAGSAMQWVYLLHETLLGGAFGETLIGISGLLLMTAAATGLYVAWPKRRQWKAAFSVSRWRSPPQKLYGWHRAVGLLTGFALLVIAPCGIYMVFANELRPALAKLVPHHLPYKIAPAPADFRPTESAQAALDRAHALFPDGRFVRLTLPTAEAPAYRIRLRQPGETRAWSGVTTIVIDARTGRTLNIYDPLKAPLSNRILDAAYSIHNGEVAHLAGRLLVMLAGLALPTLYITGIKSWLGKRRRKKSGKRRAAPQSASASAGSRSAPLP
ncbi:hypothetical protein CLG96_01525 [Sphingomonas oleivorans]|uniref:Peptidase n=1 Tax=Sphingomonas oleivorans TaxID=1735121 RepID=A0A2T5G121_9SPHN|nr:PepSY-associated TM helix domain-containing protein [Sphingomonas oleivorans]PTQ12855.1 hypothetical protein CLG96_01525 [Sphingomonas oleivorans]